MFNDLIKNSVNQQFALLGQVPIEFDGCRYVAQTQAIIDYDTEIMLEDGQVITNAIMVSLIKADVGNVKRGDCITVFKNDPTKQRKFKVGEAVKDDGFVIDAYVRNA